MHGTLRHREIVTRPRCLDCPAQVAAPRSKRCETCRDARLKAQAKQHLQKFFKTPKGRALRRKHEKLHRQRRPDLHRANSRRYYARLRPEGKLSTGKSGTVRYLAKHIAHVKAWRAHRRKQRQQRALAICNMPVTRQQLYPFAGSTLAANPDVIAVNAIVPRGIPGREDICQNILLAILEGSATIAELSSSRAALSTFYRAHRRENFELGGYAVSLNEPRHDGRSWHDILPDTATLWGQSQW